MLAFTKAILNRYRKIKKTSSTNKKLDIFPLFYMKIPNYYFKRFVLSRYGLLSKVGYLPEQDSDRIKKAGQ